MTYSEALLEVLEFAKEWEATFSRDEDNNPKDLHLLRAIQKLENLKQLRTREHLIDVLADFSGQDRGDILDSLAETK